LEHRVLHVEDRGFLLPRRCFDAIAYLTQTHFRARDGVLEPCELRRDLVIANDVMRNVRHLPDQEMHVADGDAGRSGNAAKQSFHYADSPNLLSINCESA